MRLRPAMLLLLSVAVLAGACTGGSEAGGDGDTPAPATLPPLDTSARELASAACENTSHEALLRTWRGVRTDRSGDIQIIPRNPNFVNGGLTHATPFDYTQEVPLLLYGPGFVRPGEYGQSITLADLAPTLGALLKFPFDTPDGDPQLQALLPEAERHLPRLVVTIVWDSAGMDVLERWPDAWPYLTSLRAEGAWFTRATVGASPSNTPIGHATIGTGTFPRSHGFVDEYIRVNGRLQKPNENGPGFLIDPTLADLYDRAMGNEPERRRDRHAVGAHHDDGPRVPVGRRRPRHRGHAGEGDRRDRRRRERELEPHVGHGAVLRVPRLRERPARRSPSTWTTLDRAGRGARRQVAGQRHRAARRPGSTRRPGRRSSSTLIEAVIEREGFGADDVPDLLFLNYKAIDTIGHLFSADGIEMSDAVTVQDQTLERLVDFLDEQVGGGPLGHGRHRRSRNAARPRDVWRVR